MIDATATGDGAGLRRAGRGWLPPRLWSEARGLSDAALGRLLVALVTASAGDLPSPKADQPEPAEPHKAGRRSVRRLARAYGWSHADTLAMPWPDFLDAAAELPALEAEETLRAMTAAHPAQETVDRLVRIASGDQAGRSAAPRQSPWERAGLSEAEWRRARRMDLRRVQQAIQTTFGTQPPGEA